jgi:YceI-like domain
VFPLIARLGERPRSTLADRLRRSRGNGAKASLRGGPSNHQGIPWCELRRDTRPYGVRPRRSKRPNDDYRHANRHPDPAGTWTVDPVHSAATFTAKYMMVGTFRGEFTQIEGSLTDGKLD